MPAPSPFSPDSTPAPRREQVQLEPCVQLLGGPWDGLWVPTRDLQAHVQWVLHRAEPSMAGFLWRRLARDPVRFGFVGEMTAAESDVYEAENILPARLRDSECRGMR